MSEVSLFDEKGNRKYVTPEERQRFYDATGEVSKEWRMLGLMFYYTGCRITEALKLRVKDIDFSSSAVTLNSLKQRRDDVYRQVPLPDSFLRSLDDVFDLRMMQKRSRSRNSFIWGYSRKHGYTTIKRMMKIAKIEGIQATPKGLRHGYAGRTKDCSEVVGVVKRRI